jgi:hypothetical protein
VAPNKGLIYAASPREISDASNERDGKEERGCTSAATSCHTISQNQSKHQPAPAVDAVQEMTYETKVA